MKKILYLSLIAAFLPLTAFCQLKKKLKFHGIYVTTGVNYYPQIEPYTLMNNFWAERGKLNLTFLTRNSGTFSIEGDSSFITRVRTSEVPSPGLNMGAGVQIISYNRVFHELAITKLSTSRSGDVTSFEWVDTLGEKQIIDTGFKEKSFAFGFRYELGKYFGKSKTARIRFGISFSMETSFYSMERTPITTQGYPIEGKVMNFEISLNPLLTAQLSKRIYLDFKLLPNMMIADFESVRENNPTLPQAGQKLNRVFNLPEINVAGNVQLRFELQKAKRKKRGG